MTFCDSLFALQFENPPRILVDAPDVICLQEGLEGMDILSQARRSEHLIIKILMTTTTMKDSCDYASVFS